MTDFVFTSTHTFFWSNRDPVPIGKVADSLLALEKIVKTSRVALAGLTDVDIQNIDVYIEALESGSLLEKIFIKLVFKDEASFDTFLDRIGERIRKPGMARNVAIGAVLALLVGYCAWLAAKNSNPSGQTTIEANNKVIINIGAGALQMSPEAFKAIVEAAVSNKKELAKSAVKLFEPARSDPQASLVIDGDENISFPPEVIAATPRQVQIDRDEKVEHLRDVDLQIRATDLDSTDRGWAALIPGKIDRRVRLMLDPNVRPAEVADKFQLRADVSVYYKLDGRSNRLAPDHIVLHQVIE